MADSATLNIAAGFDTRAVPGETPKEYKHSKRKEKKVSLCRIVSICLYVYQVSTQLYVSVQYLVPFLFSEYDPSVQYYLKVLMCYILAMGFVNWLCLVCVSSEYKPSKDHPDVLRSPPDRFRGVRFHRDAHVVGDVTSKGALPWRYCATCDMRVPPRTHHCKFCQTCVMRLDHHCHLAGHCVGHWNQRYFVVLSVYTSAACVAGIFMTVPYLYCHHDNDTSLWLYLAPCMLFKVLTGSVDSVRAVLIFHVYMEVIFGFLSSTYTYGQFKFIARGKTIYEVAKNKKMLVTSSRQENFQLVFGNYWWLNFVFPAQIVFKQTNDGLHYDGVKAE